MIKTEFLFCQDTQQGRIYIYKCIILEGLELSKIEFIRITLC